MFLQKPIPICSVFIHNCQKLKHKYSSSSKWRNWSEMLLNNKKEQSVWWRQIWVNFDYIILSEQCCIQKGIAVFFLFICHSEKGKTTWKGSRLKVSKDLWERSGLQKQRTQDGRNGLCLDYNGIDSTVSISQSSQNMFIERKWCCRKSNFTSWYGLMKTHISCHKEKAS